MIRELEQLVVRLNAADQAFGEAGDAVLRYAGVHAETWEQAATALRLWQSAAGASAAAHGVVGAVAAPGAPLDPEGTLARASSMVAQAREALAVAGRVLAHAMEEAQHGAPTEPGLFAKLRSFLTGVGEGVGELVSAPVALVALAVRLDPLRAIYDPSGYAATQEAFYGGIVNIAAHHKMETLEKLIDLDTWREDPARALGKLVPDLAMLGIGAVAGGSERAAAAGERLGSVAETIERVGPEGRLSADLNPDLADRRLAELGLTSDSPAGRAALKQLNIPGAAVDQWIPVRLHDGDVIAVARSGRIVTPVAGEPATDAGTFAEPLQVAPQRYPGLSEIPTQPQLPGTLKLYRVHGEDLPGASASALSNPQFGHGGGTLYSIPDFDDAVDSGRLVPIGEHSFDPHTLVSGFEDPRYRQLDPDLPQRALDPDHERHVGQVEEARKHVRDHFRDAALTVGTEAGSESTDQVSEHAAKGAG
jgi:hypothetical protein